MKEYRVNVLLQESVIRFIYAAVNEAAIDSVKEGDPRKPDMDYFLRKLDRKLESLNKK